MSPGTSLARSLAGRVISSSLALLFPLDDTRNAYGVRRARGNGAKWGQIFESLCQRRLLFDKIELLVAVD